MREELNTSKSNELLKRSVLSEPLTISQLEVFFIFVWSRDIREKNIVFNGILISSKHKVNTFGELGGI